MRVGRMGVQWEWRASSVVLMKPQSYADTGPLGLWGTDYAVTLPVLQRSCPSLHPWSQIQPVILSLPQGLRFSFLFSSPSYSEISEP